MAKVYMSKQDKEWQAESDAKTLANAAEISSDKARANRAIKAAKKMAKDAEKTVKNVKKQVAIKYSKRRKK